MTPALQAEQTLQYEFVADCAVAGWAFRRGERWLGEDLERHRRTLLNAGLLREIRIEDPRL